jgi:hypothetical protein
MATCRLSQAASYPEIVQESCTEEHLLTVDPNPGEAGIKLGARSATLS